MKINLKLLSFAILLGVTAPTFATNKALLIGISDYKDSAISDLEGPINDINALKKTLIKHWHFNEKNIKELSGNKATKNNILQALTELKDNAKADDHIFIYYSGHGSSYFDGKLGAVPKFYSSSGAILPYEFNKTEKTKAVMLNNLIIGKRDLKPILLALDKTNAHTLIVFDTCYSGNTVRSVRSDRVALASRSQDVGSDIDDSEDDNITYNLASEHQKNKDEAYPYENITYLAAASPREPAKDISQKNLDSYLLSTIDDKPHGVFTDALLRGMSGKLKTDQNGDGKTIYNELLASIKDYLVAKGHTQIPQILPATAEEDKKALRYQRVLGQSNTLGHDIKLSAPILSVNVRPASDELINKIKRLSLVEVSSQRADLNLEKVGNNYVMTNRAGDEISTLKSPTQAIILGRIKQEAWKKQFKRLLQEHATINMELSVNNGASGDVLVEGETMAFLVGSDKPIYLLLLNADSGGGISLLYPYLRHEIAGIPAHTDKYIPSKNKQDWIKVQKPFGSEHLIAIGFAEKPAFLKDFIGLDCLKPNSDLYNKLINSLKTEKYGFSVLDLFTVKKQLGKNNDEKNSNNTTCTSI